VNGIECTAHKWWGRNSLDIGAVHSSSTLLLPAVLQQLQNPKQQVAAEAKQ
jgi:hypothetical protein